MRRKYKIGDLHDLSWLGGKGNKSAVWRSVVTGLKEVVVPGLAWVVGDGRRIRFWMDK